MTKNSRVDISTDLNEAIYIDTANFARHGVYPFSFYDHSVHFLKKYGDEHLSVLNASLTTLPLELEGALVKLEQERSIYKTEEKRISRVLDNDRFYWSKPWMNWHAGVFLSNRKADVQNFGNILRKSKLMTEYMDFARKELFHPDLVDGFYDSRAAIQKVKILCHDIIDAYAGVNTIHQKYNR